MKPANVFYNGWFAFRFSDRCILLGNICQDEHDQNRLL